MTDVATMRVNILAADESEVPTTVFQLLQWKHALRLEISTGLTMSGGRKVSTHLRKLLKVKRSYPKADLLSHIETSLESIQEQLKELS